MIQEKAVDKVIALMDIEHLPVMVHLINCYQSNFRFSRVHASLKIEGVPLSDIAVLFTLEVNSSELAKKVAMDLAINSLKELRNVSEEAHRPVNAQNQFAKHTRLNLPD